MEILDISGEEVAGFANYCQKLQKTVFSLLTDCNNVAKNAEKWVSVANGDFIIKVYLAGFIRNGHDLRQTEKLEFVQEVLIEEKRNGE